MTDKRKNKKNFICNFRAPNLETWREWRDFVNLVKNEHHSDVCHILLMLIRAYKAGFDHVKQTQILTPFNIINLNMQNTFHYIVSRARRKTPIEGLETCICPRCNKIATHEIAHTNGNTYHLCEQHTNEYQRVSLKTTPLLQGKILE